MHPPVSLSRALEYVFNYNFPLIPLPPSPSDEDYFVALGNESWLARGITSVPETWSFSFELVGSYPAFKKANHSQITARTEL